MAQKRLTNLAQVAALCVAWGCCAPWAGAQTTQSVEPPATILNDPSAAGAQREEAARRLLMRRDANSRTLLLKLLTDFNNPRAQLAVARALIWEPNPDAVYLTPLKQLLGAERNVAEAAALALASYPDQPEAVDALVGCATARQQREALRAAAIRALGSVPQKAAAQTLVDLLSDPQESARIHAAAAEALADMSGQGDWGSDAARWQQWWGQNRDKPEQRWKADLFIERAGRLTALQYQYRQLVEDLQALLTEQYQQAPQDSQSDLLMKYLKSPTPQMRAIGARIVRDEAQAARRVPQAARDYLRTLVGDSSPAVRLATALALHAINDAQALGELLAQLPRENSAEIRAAIAAALASIGDLSAVPALRKQLEDPSTSAATAAAQALRDLGAKLRQADPAQARQLAEQLRSLMVARPSQPGSTNLRDALVEAMVPLRDPELLATFYRVLREGDTSRMRRAALKGLGELGESKAADAISHYLDDPEPTVRLEAVVALGRTSAVDHAGELFRRTLPAEESDPQVRERAWRVLESLFPTMPADQLAGWVDRFKDDPSRRLIVLKALAGKYVKDRKEEQLAYTRQSIGDGSMELNQPAEAAPYYKLALDYWRGRGAEDMVTEKLIEQYLVALLRARMYPEALAFGQELIAYKPVYQQTVGANVRAEVERLKKAAEVDSALKLIDGALAMTPALAAQYREDLTDLRNELRKTPSTAASNGGPAGK